MVLYEIRHCVDDRADHVTSLEYVGCRLNQIDHGLSVTEPSISRQECVKVSGASTRDHGVQDLVGVLYRCSWVGPKAVWASIPWGYSLSRMAFPA